MTPEFFRFIAELTGGNPGALSAVTAIITHVNEPQNTHVFLMALKRLELSGPQIWELYKDECQCDPGKFCQLILKKFAEKLMQPQVLAKEL